MFYRIQGLILFIVIFFSAFIAEAEGGEECLKNNVRTVKTKEYAHGSPFLLRSRLIGEELSGYFISRMRATLRLKEDNGHLNFHFLRKDGMLGLPYQINKVVIVLGARVVFEEDFTEGCRRVGLSLFPGGQHQRYLKISRESLEACDSGCELKLIVFGGLY